MAFKDLLVRRARKAVSVRALTSLSPQQIILEPIVTEKTYKTDESKDAKEGKNKYFFKVHAKANKNDVKCSIHFLYKVDVEGVNIIVTPFKGRANRKLVRRSYKKAIVVLKKGQKIELL